MTLPSLYVPQSPEDFIGDAAKYARLLNRVVTDAKAAGNAPIKVLFNGEPGIGKSALARYFIQLLGANPKWSVTKLNGTQVKIEKVEEIAQALWYREMFGSYRVVWIEEADAIPTVAQVRLLTMVDDLPSGCAVICTSNCVAADFVKRFQTRFKVYEVDAPSAADIHVLLGKFLTNKQTITQIAEFSCGNVRAALLDAETALQSAA